MRKYPSTWFALLCLVAAGASAPAVVTAQYVPPEEYRFEQRLRPTLLGYEPFAELLPGRFGLAVNARTVQRNNALSLADAGALGLLAREDSLTAWDIADLAPRIGRVGQIELFSATSAQVNLMLGLGPLTLGLHGGGRGYGEAVIEEAFVTLLTRGNQTLAAFDLEGTGGWGLATAEVGARAVYRFDPGLAGPTFVFGGGVRLIRPAALFEGGLAEGGRVVVSGDSLVARFDAEVHTTEFDGSLPLSDRLAEGSTAGSGLAVDMTARAEWSRMAVEFSLLDVGSVTVRNVESRTLAVDYAVTSVDSLISLLDDRRSNAAGDSLAFVLQGVAEREVTLPWTMRGRIAYEATGWLYLDGAVSMRSARYRRPVRSEIGLTLAPLSWLPLRANMIMGEGGAGFGGGVMLDAGPILMEVRVSTLAGFLDQGRGVGGVYRLVLRL